jgi:hypothetical protein
MVQLFEEGGYPMWFLLVAALATFVAAGRFAAQPTRARLALTRSLGRTVLLSLLMGTAAAVAAVGHGAAGYLARHPEETIVTVLLQGMAECMSPAIFGFSSLAIVSVLVAVGRLRAGDEI